MTRTLTVSERANRLGAFVLVGNEKIIKPLVAERLEEPFATRQHLSTTQTNQRRAYIYGPGNSLKALKHKHVSSTSTGPCTFNRQRWMANNRSFQ